MLRLHLIFNTNSPTGWDEAEGLHNRGDFDLSQHEKYSKQDLHYLDPVTNEKYIPYIIETAMGLDRNVLTFIADAYTEEMVPTADGGEEKNELL